MIIGLRILIWLITTILLSNCTLDPTNTAGPAPIPTDRSTIVSRRPATFTESYRWADGLAVEVVQINHRRLLASIPVDTPTAQRRRFVQRTHDHRPQRIRPHGQDYSHRPAPLRPRPDFGGHLRGHSRARRPRHRAIP